MEAFVRRIVIGALAVFIVALGYATTHERAGWDLLGAAQLAAGTGSGSGMTGLIEAWPPFCAAETSYELLTLPQDAAFSISPSSTQRPNKPQSIASTPAPASTAKPTSTATPYVFPTSSSIGLDACAELGIVGGRKVVACRGQGPAQFQITARNRAGSQTFIAALGTCTNGQPSSTPALTKEPIAAATLTPALHPTTSTPVPAPTLTP